MEILFSIFFKDPERCQRHGSSCLDSQGLLLTQEYSSLKQGGFFMLRFRKHFSALFIHKLLPSEDG